ncbi:hypothetical protein QBC46DRAFT_349074 [Diplogelasinospora grovesii]|uniref:Uncharacterized protein n=1 Tax=Diplogelasinospora grovesii TaxID=303347 RepID=A0AAN6NHB2_9PEZI|nr:hypothetical protein QBC46DRAFT_349074 [Diplogelasinospora grovesii]
MSGYDPDHIDTTVIPEPTLPVHLYIIVALLFLVLVGNHLLSIWLTRWQRSLPVRDHERGEVEGEEFDEKAGGEMFEDVDLDTWRDLVDGYWKDANL